MFAKVAPAVKLPRFTWDFDYRIEGNLDVHRGSLVEIPWRNRKVMGVVLGTSEESEIPVSKMKSIIGLVTEDRLPEDVMAALEWSAKRYLSSSGLLAKRFFPTPPKRRKPLTEDLRPIIDSEQLNLSRRWGRIRLYGSPEEKWTVLEGAVGNCLETGHSALVLVPHQDEMKDTTKALKAVSGNRMVEIHGKLAAGTFWRNWEMALAGKASVVVGSRLASMVPIRRLGLIVVLESDSQDHKQYDQNPRYDARAIAKIRSDISGAELMMMTQAPRTEEIALLDEGFKLETGSIEPSVAILADMSALGKEWSGPLSPASVERMRQSLQNNKKVLIYHNRHGVAGALVCTECRFVQRCTRCSLAMAVREKDLYCPRCGHTEAQPTTCPECHGVRLKPIGFGTASVRQSLKKEFPEATIEIIDANMKVDQALKSDIMIGSKSLLHDLSEKHGGADFGTIIVTSAEDLLRHSGFRATEEAWGTIRKLRYLSAQSDTETVIQTLSPDDRKIRDLVRDLKPFLYDELASRKLSGYPPIGRLILVVAQEKTEVSAEKKIQEAYEILKKPCEANGPRTVLSRPFCPSRPMVRGSHRRAIAIKAMEIGSELMDALRKLPENYIIDPDPETPI